MALLDSVVNKIENEALIFAEQRPTDNSETSRVYKAGCSFGYANGAINEAERSEGLVKALEELSMFQQTVNHGWDITRVREIATAALTAYQLFQTTNK